MWSCSFVLGLGGCGAEDVGAEVVAGYLAIRGAFDGHSALGFDCSQTPEPERDSYLRHTSAFSEV